MNMPMWFSNLAFWSAQVALLVAAAGFLPRVFQIRQPRVLLAYWRSLLAISLVLPFAQPWHRTQNIGTINVAPEFVRDIPLSGPAVPHWHFPGGQLIAEIAAIAILVGIAARFAILALGLLRLRRMRQASLPISAVSESYGILEEMRARVDASAEFRISADVDSPVTFGFAAPVILLPERFPSLDARFQSAIACHELLHVRRRDWAHHLAEEILRAVLWFHPAFAWLIGRVRLVREQVVDLEVVKLTNAPKVYVETLLEFSISRDRVRAIPAPPFLRERQLTERVALMLKEVRMSRTRLIASLTVIAACIALAASAAFWAFPLKASPRAAQNPSQSAVAPRVSDDVTSGTPGEGRVAQQPAEAGSKIVVADLRIEGKVSDVDAVRARILKGLQGREFDRDSKWLAEITEINIRRDFQDRGYFKVVAHDPEAQPLDSAKYQMLVIIHLDEGEQYRTGEISIASNDPDRALVITAEELRQQFHLRTGDLFNVEQLRNGFEGVKRLYDARGYVDETMVPMFQIDEKNDSIATTMRVDQGNQYRVGKFEVRGVDAGTQKLLESRMRSGDIFNPILLEEIFEQGKAATGTNVSFQVAVETTRHIEARTFDVLIDFSPAATLHTN
jgi:beta-lactamase regulating signal transducer with metallopeptidase domain